MYIFAKTSNATTQICKVWPPCTACQPGNLETPSEHLSVSRSGRTRWPEDMMRPGEPGLVWNTQHSPHTRPTVCELPARNQDGRTHGNIACKRNNKLRTAQQQASAATVQNRAAGTFSHRKQRQQRKIDKSAKCGLPSQHASQETWKPPASTLAHRLAVIHPQRRGDVLAERVYPTKLTPLHGVDLVHPACAPHPANGVRTNQPQ